MYSVKSISTSGETKTQSTFHSFGKAKKYYDDFCAWMPVKEKTEIEDGTILAWSIADYCKIEFEKLTQNEAQRLNLSYES